MVLLPLSDDARRWRNACRRAVERQKQLLARGNGVSTEGAVVGAGGDITLAIDREFEEIALEELAEPIGAAGPGVVLVSEEAGETGSRGAGTVWVIIDPIDGSTNIASDLPQFSLSVAVAAGPSMADVWFGYVFDFGANEEFVCEKSRALELNGVGIASRRARTNLVGVESAEPTLLVHGLGSFEPTEIKEIRVVGSIAIALCYVALGRFDGLLTCKHCRSVDAAAGQLAATYSGAHVLFDESAPAGTGLGLNERYRLVAACSSDVARILVEAQRKIPLVPR